MNEDKKISVRTRAIIFDKNELLVVKHRMSDKHYALPGGHLEWGEDIIKSLKREILEELGIIPEVGRLLYINNYTEKNEIQSIELFYEVKNSQEYRNLENLERTHGFEIKEIYWAKQNDDINILPKGFWEDFKTRKAMPPEVMYVN